jgi:hypothetical protein
MQAQLPDACVRPEQHDIFGWTVAANIVCLVAVFAFYAGVALIRNCEQSQ